MATKSKKSQAVVIETLTPKQKQTLAEAGANWRENRRILVSVIKAQVGKAESKKFEAKWVRAARKDILCAATGLKNPLDNLSERLEAGDANAELARNLSTQMTRLGLNPKRTVTRHESAGRLSPKVKKAFDDFKAAEREVERIETVLEKARFAVKQARTRLVKAAKKDDLRLVKGQLVAA